MRYDYDDYEIDRGVVHIKKDGVIIATVELNDIIEFYLNN